MFPTIHTRHKQSSMRPLSYSYLYPAHRSRGLVSHRVSVGLGFVAGLVVPLVLIGVIRGPISARCQQVGMKIETSSYLGSGHIYKGIVTHGLEAELLNILKHKA